MENFPSIEPVYSSIKNAAPLKAATVLGDGYIKKFSFGLNTIKPEWNIEWILSPADASSVDLFLENRGADGEWFYWTPPDYTVPLRWRCDEWTLENDAENLVKVNASFKQILELEYIELEPSFAVCADDFCGRDTGGGGEGPPFDTTLYNYARFIGTKIGRYHPPGPLSQPGGDIRIQTETNSPWINIGDSSPDLCFLTMRPEGRDTVPKNPLYDVPGAFVTPEGNYKWVCNYDSVIEEENDSTFLSTNTVRCFIFRDGSLINTIDGVSASNIDLQGGTLYATCRGKWQFKRSATQPLITAPADAEWIGNLIPGFSPSDATWEYTPTVPPYTLIP